MCSPARSHRSAVITRSLSFGFSFTNFIRTTTSIAEIATYEHGELPSNQLVPTDLIRKIAQGLVISLFGDAHRQGPERFGILGGGVRAEID